LAWDVEPLAFSVIFPPQFTSDNAALSPAALLVLSSLEHPDKISAPVAKTLSAAPNRFGFNSVPSCRDETGSPPS